MVVTVYCSGGIKKGKDQRDKLCWTDRERSDLSTGARPVCVGFFRPDDPCPCMDDSLALFGRDVYQLRMADIVVVDARQRRGIGIGVEMLAARFFGKPLVAVVPPDSHYRQRHLRLRGGQVINYLHPHLSELPDVVVDDFFAAGRWIASYVHGGARVKTLAILEDAITAYRQSMLRQDPGMQRSLHEIQHAALRG